MSTSDTTNALLTANESLAEWLATGKSLSVEGGFQYPRGTLAGEAFVVSTFGVKTPMLGKEGSHWVCLNTPNTAVTMQNNSSFAATTPGLVVQNNNSLGGKSIYLHRLKFSVVAVGTSSTNWDCQILVDNVKRYTSGGSTLTPTNANNGVTAGATGAQVFLGALTAAAANSSRTVYAARMRTVIPVAGDTPIFEFGSSAPMVAGAATDGTAAMNLPQAVAPIVIAPQQSMLLYEYGASQGAARTFDMFVLEYIER